MPKYLTRQSPGIAVEHSEPDNDEMYHVRGTTKCGEAWKLDVGAECNRLIEFAEVLEELHRTHIFEKTFEQQQLQRAADIRSLVARVAAFGELETE